MRVVINRNTCDKHLAFCERCLGRFLQHPMGYERQCFEELEDDGKDELTIELHTGDVVETFVLDEADRAMMAVEGWAYFVDFAVPMYRTEKEPRQTAP